jgi:hypothetical protein
VTDDLETVSKADDVPDEQLDADVDGADNGEVGGGEYGDEGEF